MKCKLQSFIVIIIYYCYCSINRLLKRYGFVPSTKSTSNNLAASFNQGLDAGLVIDQLNTRLNQLETTIKDTAKNNNNHSDDNDSDNDRMFEPYISPSKRRVNNNGSNYNKLTTNNGY